MDNLKPLLKHGDVDYTEKILNVNDDIISGLSTNVFVSDNVIFIAIIILPGQNIFASEIDVYFIDCLLT